MNLEQTAQALLGYHSQTLVKIYLGFEMVCATVVIEISRFTMHFKRGASLKSIQYLLVAPCTVPGSGCIQD